MKVGKSSTMLQEKLTLSRRKASELRKKEPRYASNNDRFNDERESKTFYSKDSKTVIDFSVASQGRQKQRKKIELVPKSLNQEKYILSLLDSETDIVVVSGPAGTGKTYLAVLAAIQAFRDGVCSKIVLTRPKVAVEDEDHGFLPGDLNQKMEPWVKPLLDIFGEFFSAKELKYLIDDQIIEIAPLGFCRGRTFKNSWIIVDEAQNSSPSQLKMIMTRIGENSKIIIGGDIEQTDRTTYQNGLLDLVGRLDNKPTDGIVVCKFTEKDIRRHRMIEHILKLYN